MSDEAFSILEFLANGYVIYESHIVERGASFYRTILFLMDSGYARKTDADPNFLYHLPANLQNDFQIRVTAAGLEAYRAEREIRDQRARQQHDDEAKKKIEDKRYRRDAIRTWAIALLGIASDVFCVLLGAYLGAYTTLLNWFLSLFH